MGVHSSVGINLIILYYGFKYILLVALGKDTDKEK
jgi:hypothetical protein